MSLTTQALPIWRFSVQGLWPALVALLISGCPAGSSDPSDTPPDETPPTPETVLIGGVLIGMTGASTSVTLTWSSAAGTNHETMTLSENGPFAFGTALPEGTAWEVGPAAIVDVDSRQLCRIDGSRTGIASVANATSVLIICEDYYRVGGIVTGLEGSGLVLFESTGRIRDTVNSNGPFSIDGYVAGQSYEFSIEAQPSDPEQECVVYGGTGVVGNADITDVEVECGTMTIGGTVYGLTGSGLTLGLSAELEEDRMVFDFEILPIDANGEFQFQARLPVGVDYEVRVYQQPVDPEQECIVANGAGTVSANVSDVEIRCPRVHREFRFDNQLTSKDGPPLHSGTLAGNEVLYETFSFGAGPAVPLGSIAGFATEDLFQVHIDREGADGVVYSNESGKTFWVAAESPTGVRFPQIGASHENMTELETWWLFRKEADATNLQLEVSEVYLLAFDDTHAENAGGRLRAEAQLWINAYTKSGDALYDAEIFSRHGNVALQGSLMGQETQWVMMTWNDPAASFGLWTTENFFFDFIGDEGGFAPEKATLVLLVHPIPIPIDVSSLPVGTEFYVKASALVVARNSYSPEGGTAAFLRDPATFMAGDPDDPQSLDDPGSVRMLFTEGLKLLDIDTRPQPAPDTGGIPAPACESGERSTIQFDAAHFQVNEGSENSTYIRITRSGVLAGLVTARVRLLENTARAGTDFELREFDVRFGDQDNLPRSLELPIIDDDVMESDEDLTVVLVEPEGCAEIGTRSMAQVTILDDDVPAGPQSYSLGGTVTGLLGSGLILTNLSTNDLEIMADGTFAFAQNFGSGSRYEVRVAAQPTGPGQFCSVSNGSGIIVDSDVTDIEVTCEALSPGDGQLDDGFGTNGKVTIGVPGGATDMTVQPDGKILVIGNNTLARYTADGDLDSSFGTGGIVTVEFYGASYDRLHAVAVQSDGQIVVAGYSKDGVNSPVQEDVVVARYDANGNLDLNFGIAGKVVTDFEARGDAANDLLIQPDGDIVVTGYASIVDQFGLAGSDFAAIRYSSSGTLDSGFGIDGKANTEVAGRTDLGYAAAMQLDRKIVLAGRVANSGGDNPDIGLVRYNADGSLDTSFAAGGVLRDVTGEWDEAADIVVQPDGGLVVVGHTVIGSASMLTIARYNSDGSHDSTFGANGRVTDAIMDVGRSIALQLDGSIVVVGRRSGEFAIARFDSLGSPDMNFGTDGVIDVDFFGGIDEAKAVVIQPDGKILAAGTSANGTTTGLGLVRVRGQ